MPIFPLTRGGLSGRMARMIMESRDDGGVVMGERTGGARPPHGSPEAKRACPRIPSLNPSPGSSGGEGWGGVWRRGARALMVVGTIFLGGGRALGGEIPPSSFQPLAPLLREVVGWEGDLLVLELDADGQGGSLGRSYARGGETAEVRVLVGPEVKNYLGGMLPGVALMESTGLRLERFTEGSFDVVLRSEKEAKGGAVVVILSSEDRGALVVEYEGLPPDAALALAREFDWRGMADRLPEGMRE